ncbi:hypothetical protein LXA43DRAFT_1067641 [Ganoderma leucocontextum]|nr:hypothetical protein LXA43DRAFT_1067641 [Ganoderma leucocontextum]
MTFRGGSHKGRLAAFASHVELSAGYIPPTHLHLVLDIFEHAQGITGLSVGDFDTTLSSFLLPGGTPESESNATTTAAHELGTPADGMREVEASLSDVLARRLLACWARNRSLTKFSIDYRLVQPARLLLVPCQWRSDAILEEERFPSVTDLSVHLGNKPTSKWHGGWRPAFPNMTHLALKVGDGDTSGGSKLGSLGGSLVRLSETCWELRESAKAGKGRTLQPKWMRVTMKQLVARMKDLGPRPVKSRSKRVLRGRMPVIIRPDRQHILR